MLRNRHQRRPTRMAILDPPKAKTSARDPVSLEVLVGYFKRKQKKYIRKRTDTDVAFTREYSRVSIFHRERECTN